MKRLSDILRRWRDDSAGTIAIIGAMGLIMLGMCAGMAVDYARALSVRTKLQGAADGAALAAGSDPYFTEAQAQQLVNGYLAANARGTVAKITPAITLARTSGGGSDRVNITIKASVPTTLLQIVGIQDLPVTVASNAGMSLGDAEIYAAIDMSASLGLAADPAARNALETLTSTASGGTVKCNFACHQRDGWEPVGKTVYQMARDANIALREDVLTKAFGTFADTFLSPSDPAVAANHKRMGVIGFSDAATMLQIPINDAARVKAAPALFPAAARLNTRFEIALPQIKTMIGAQGSGLNGSAQKTLLLITDGVQWQRNVAGAVNGPINQALCDSFKSAGITLAILEVKYLEATGEYWFENQVRPFYPNISPALSACASPGFYFQATDSDSSTLATAFNKVAIALRTQLALGR